MFPPKALFYKIVLFLIAVFSLINSVNIQESIVVRR